VTPARRRDAAGRADEHALPLADARAASSRRRSALSNRPRRFAQRTGFGELRCDVLPLTVKIFSLPKTATQSPREALSGGTGESP
jgi:hypothetical protein